MRFFVKVSAFDSIVRDDDIRKTRRAFREKAEQIRESGKLVEGGAMADGRGGVFILEVGSHSELLSLLAPQIVDHFEVDCHPLVSFDELMELFARQEE